MKTSYTELQDKPEREVNDALMLAVAESLNCRKGFTVKQYELTYNTTANLMGYKPVGSLAFETLAYKYGPVLGPLDGKVIFYNGNGTYCFYSGVSKSEDGKIIISKKINRRLS